MSEILLQQTTAQAVAKVYPRFLAQFDTWSTLASADLDDIRGTIMTLGLAERRSRRLQQLANWVLEHGSGLPASRVELELIPGIGQYVASGIMAARGEPEPLLDVNMARLLQRLFGIRERVDIRDDPWLQHASRRVFPGRELGWAVLDFAALVCTARAPSCGTCPLQQRCISYAEPA